MSGLEFATSSIIWIDSKIVIVNVYLFIFIFYFINVDDMGKI